MNPVVIIEKKRDGEKLSTSEIQYMVNEFTSEKLPKYQMAAFLMAIACKGMDDQETADLTDAMLYSGKVLKFSSPQVIDKHSTGGVGDKASFILGPLAASCGIKVPMLAGRGLAHTGGTIDKMESLPGWKTQFTLKEFQKKVMDHGLCIMGQTGEIAPADKVIYQLRDVTGTVPSIPLITASIMSKKLASGIKGMVFDVKVGKGAFCQTMKMATDLSKSMLKTADRYKKKMTIFITEMDFPLGDCVGNSLEIWESWKTLKGEGPEDLTELSVILAAEMVHMGGKAKTLTEAKKMVRQNLKEHKGLECFQACIERQGGKIKPSKADLGLKWSDKTLVIKSPKSGTITEIHARDVGLLAIELKAGRKQAGEKLFHETGFHFHKTVGDRVKKGDAIATLYYGRIPLSQAKKVKTKLENQIIKISTQKYTRPPLIKKTLRNWR